MVAVFLVRLTGVEPAAFGVGVQRSIQLSYKRIYLYLILWSLSWTEAIVTAAMRQRQLSYKRIK